MAEAIHGSTISRRSALAAGAIAAAVLGRRAQAAAVKHVALLGDSVFDNAAYVGGAPDVRAQVASLLPGGSRVTLIALDGAVIADVAVQLRRLPSDTTHIVISAGGNDALQASGVLDQPATAVAEALERLAAIGEMFGQDYTALLDLALESGVPVAACTIYDPRFPEPDRRRIGSTALTVLNDRISRNVFSRGMTLIDLRLICDRDEDFANPIEPSVHGGMKIARAIVSFVTDAPPSAAVVAKK
jgi:hypothetical protein